MWRVLPVILSVVVLGAHFFRAGAQVPLVACVVVLGLLAVPRPWAARLVQAALVLGTVEWLLTLVRYAGERAAQGTSATRLVAILGTVAAVTLLSALVFRHRRIARYYRLGPGDP